MDRQRILSRQRFDSAIMGLPIRHLGSKTGSPGVHLEFPAVSLMAALSGMTAMMIGGRALQGVGGVGITVMVNAVVSLLVFANVVNSRSRGIYLGIIAVACAVATSLGPIIGGALSNKISWRW